MCIFLIHTIHLRYCFCQQVNRLDTVTTYGVSLFSIILNCSGIIGEIVEASVIDIESNLSTIPKMVMYGIWKIASSLRHGMGTLKERTAFQDTCDHSKWESGADDIIIEIGKANIYTGKICPHIFLKMAGLKV